MDTSIRTIETRGTPEQLFVQKYRAQRPMSLYSYWKPCNCGGCPGNQIHNDHIISIQDGKAMDVTKVAAYVGMEVARDLVECRKSHNTIDTDPIYCDGWHRCEQFQDHRSIDEFFTGLQNLLKTLPPVIIGCEAAFSTRSYEKCLRGFVERTAWDPEWTHIGCLKPCPKCKGKITTPSVNISLALYVSVLCAWESAREVVDLPLEIFEEKVIDSSTSTIRKMLTALDSCEAWLICPCPEREAEWGKESANAPIYSCRWIPLVQSGDWAHTTFVESIQAADVITGTARAACQRVMKRVLGL